MVNDEKQPYQRRIHRNDQDSAAIRTKIIPISRLLTREATLTMKIMLTGLGNVTWGSIEPLEIVAYGAKPIYVFFMKRR
jgi:hypothetical protein